MIRAAILTLTLGPLALATLAPSTAQARTLTCAEGTGLKATSGDVKSTITFTNRTPDKQTVYWVDYNGKRHNYQELEPGESYDQPTFLTHPWIVTGHRDKCVGVYLAERSKITVEAGIKAKYRPKNATPKTGRKIVKRKITPTPKLDESRASNRKRVATLDDDDDLYRTDAERSRKRRTFDDSDLDARDEETITRRTDRLNNPDTDLDRTYEDDDDGIIRETVRRRTDDDDDWYEDDNLDSNSSNDRDLDTADIDRDFDIEEPGSSTTLGGLWSCGSGSNRTEQTICSDRRLTRLDRELNELYRTVRKQLRPRQRTRLTRHQRRWLANRDNCGMRRGCIERKIKRRLARLNTRLERVIARRNRTAPNTRRTRRIRRPSTGTGGFQDGSAFGGVPLCEQGYVFSNGQCLRRGASNNRGLWSNGRRAAPTRVATSRGLPTTGQSLGGRVRAAPGLSERQIANLTEGASVTIIENTGERLNGYDWFKIRFRGQTGYTWGGILCTNARVRGVYEVCH